MNLEFQRGVVINKSLIIDPDIKGHDFPAIVLSHAHSDHLKPHNKHINFGSKETLDFMKKTIKKPVKSKTLSFGKKKTIEGIDVKLHSAGHILGSAQIEVQGDKTIAVTSDFKLQDSLIQKGAKIIPSDILVIESTFGLPHFSFKPRAKVYEEFIYWINKNLQKNKFIVLAGYALGKAQELTKMVTEFTNEIPLVHEKIYENNKVYEKHSVSLGDYIKLDHNIGDSNILIMPPSLINNNLLQALNFSTKKKVASALATGWNYKSYYDKVFNLSDHADFNQLIQYVKESNPSLVLVQHGFEQELARYIQRKLKIPAKSLSKNNKNQKSLIEY